MRNPRNFLAIFGLTLIILTAFQNCADFVEPQHDLASVDVNKLNVAGFKTSILPTLTANCAACHGFNQTPMFAKSATEQEKEDSFLELQPATTRYLSPASPGQSFLVMKIQGGHSGVPASVATTLSNNIQTWASGITQ